MTTDASAQAQVQAQAQTPAPEPAPQTPASTRPGWWRRNALALALAAVLLVATVGITSWKEWSDYFGTRPTQPTTVDVGIAAEFGGASWQLVDVLVGTSDDVEQIPEGTTMILARIKVTPGVTADAAAGAEAAGAAEAAATGSPGCMLRLSEEGSGREWHSAALRPIDYRTTPGYESYCLPGATEPYLLEVPFVVPTGASGELSVVIEVAQLLPRYLRLALPAL
ncbi:MAG: hypothetical protein KDB08_04195 [Microthrixaceae bacterium]|nr:hypothetical protein [Microthrixaceae bacterium]